MSQEKPSIFDNEILKQFFDDNPAPVRSVEAAAPPAEKTEAAPPPPPPPAQTPSAEIVAETVVEEPAVAEPAAGPAPAPRRSRSKKTAKARRPKISEPVEPEAPFTFSPSLFEKKGRVLSVINQKGGCGKTTTAINLAAGLAQEGFDVLLIDIDAQANATLGFGVRPTADDFTVYHIFRNTGFSDPHSVIKKTEVPHVWLVPSSKLLAPLAGELLEIKDWEYLLRQFLTQVRENFHYVVIDCPPALNSLTVNALTASDQMVIPLQTHYFSLEGMKELFLTVRSVQEKLNPLLKSGLILPTLYDKRARINRDMLDSIRNYFKEKVLDSVIHTNVKLVESVMHGQPVMTYDAASRGARDYRTLSRELITKDEDLFAGKKDGRWAKFIFQQ